jgi:hypothetical protein
MQTRCQVTALYPGDSTTAVARKLLCGHTVSPETREHAIMEKTFSEGAAPGLYKGD